VHDDGSDANGAQRHFGASIVREDHALGTETGAVANADERAVFLVDVQAARKADVPTDVHPATPQPLDSVTVPGAIQARFHARDQLDRMSQIGKHVGKLSSVRGDDNTPEIKRPSSLPACPSGNP
jgi:hypothetical protein